IRGHRTCRANRAAPTGESAGGFVPPAQYEERRRCVENAAARRTDSGQRVRKSLQLDGTAAIDAVKGCRGYGGLGSHGAHNCHPSNVRKLWNFRLSKSEASPRNSSGGVSV